MKISPYLFAIFAAPFLVFADNLAPAAAPADTTPVVNSAHAPKITCSKPSFDFRTQDEGPDISHEFFCHNSGHGPLIVSNVTVSCGCTAALIRKKGSKEAASYPVTFAPGEQVIVKATYHTSGRPGHATKVLTVVSNDPVNANFQLKFDVTVVRDVDIQPDRLYLYGIKKGQPRSSTIKILGKPHQPLHILSATPKNGTVTVTSIVPFDDPNEHRSGANLTVDLSAGLTIGNFSDDILVKTDSKKKPEVTISVLGEVTGKVQYNPKNLFFAPHQDIPVTITFTADNPMAFAIRKVASANRLTRPRVVKTAGPNGSDQYQVVVTAVKDVPKESDGKDQVIVTTNDDEMGTISIDAQVNK